MKRRVRAWLANLLIAILAASCATSGYWVPPPPEGTGIPILAATAGTGSEPVAVAESTAPPEATPTDPTAAIAPPPAATATLPAVPPDTTPILYYVQAADTLPVVAVRFGVTPEEITSPDPLPASDFLTPGQLLVIPRRLSGTTSSEHLLPDSEIVYSPSATNFDIHTFVREAGGRLNSYGEWLKSSGQTSGADVVLRVATENSINPRLLLSLLEFQSHWVYGQPKDANAERYPMGYKDGAQAGLYRQLVWAVNQLSVGYYAYREGRMTEIHFPGGEAARLAPDQNAGSVALQYFFAKLYSGQAWLDALDTNQGLPALHKKMFGDPWERARSVEPLFPPGITQPPLNLPFSRNWTWSFTGGPHGAWEHDGAYAALDFAPGATEAGCTKSNAWVTAAASGLVTRSDSGVVVVDMDGDGYEETGWVLVHLHVATLQRIPVGTWVDAGDVLGHPSCEGGQSTGTHLHIARKYNGEWIPADGPIPFNLSGWIAHYSGAAYKGTLTRDGKTITACTCSAASTFITRLDSDP